MKASIRVALLLASSCFVMSEVYTQTTRAFNQNASRSNHTGLMTGDAWTFAAGGGTSLATNSSEKSSFRGSGIAGKFSANYYFNKIGIGVSSGILTGSVSDNALNRFISERKFPVDQLQISKTNPFNSYLLAGPTVRFGNLVTVIADIKGGLFLNNPGIVSINQTGATRALYRFEAGEKNLFPGFSGSVNIAYPINSTTQFFINTDYLQSRSSVRLLDPSGGIDVATQVNRDMKLVTAGIGIIKTFSGDNRKAAAKKHIGNVKYEDIAARETGSGRPTGRRDFPAANDQVIMDDQNTMNQNCGPVTQRTIDPDGNTNEMTFACPDDAAAFNNRISMNVTVPKQTQGATFGEKVNAGLHAAGSAISQGAAARNIISGRLTWQDAGNSGTIVTNESVSAVGNLAGGAGGGAAAASYARQTNQSSFGTLVRMYAREAGSGMATGRREKGSGMATGRREKGSGMATGRRQYQPVYMDNSGSLCSNCMATIKSNPLYTEKGNHGENPLHKDRVMAGGEGIGSINIELIDISGAIIAQTKTEPDGNFFFANVPDGAYSVRIAGSILVKKGYDITTTASTDVLGTITLAPPPVELYINTGEGEDAPQQRAGISTSRSNIRNRSLAIVEADVDGDGEYESLTVTASMDGGSGERLNVASGRKTIVLEGPALQNSRRRVEVLKSNRQGDPVANNIRNITISGNGTSLTASATFEDGRKMDVSSQLTVNAAHNGVRQYNIMLADLNDDGLADAVVNNDAEEVMNSVHSGRKMIPVTVPDITGAQRNVAAPFVPGGGIISAAMRPGTPIGGIIVKGGKNPGGALRTTQTNEDGEFEFSNLEAGNYIVTLEQEMLIDDETTVIVSNRAQDHNSSRSNKSGSIIANDPDNGNTGNKTKAAQAQDHNSSRSNKSGIIANDPDNGETGNKTKAAQAQDHNSSRSNKSSSIVAGDNGNGDAAKNKDKMPVKWAAPELLKSISVEADMDGDGEYETDVTAKINDEIRLTENGDITAPQQKAGISTSRSNIRSRSGLAAVSDKLYIGYGTAEINGKIVPVKIVYKGGLKDTLKTQV